MELELQFFGGRGASSGYSIDKHGNKKNRYGSQYHTVYEYGNIKFVENNEKNHEALMETMTKNRVYVQVGGEKILRVVFFDNKNKRSKVYELDKRKNEFHLHYGYEHNEDSKTHWTDMNKQDKKYLERIIRIWNNRKK